MSKINGWGFGFFLAVLGSALSLSYAEEPLPNAVPSQGAVASTAEDATPEVENAVQTAQEEVRDPFSMTSDVSTIAPGGALVVPTIKVELQGIGFGSKDAYAVIGGEVFYKGDEKMGIKLLEVRRREVDILVNGGKTTVPLFPNQDLKKAKDRAKAKGAIKNASEAKPSEAPSSLSRGELPPS